jgi:hypothetical protein
MAENDKVDKRLIVRLKTFFDLDGGFINSRLMVVESRGDEDRSSSSEMLEFS